MKNLFKASTSTIMLLLLAACGHPADNEASSQLQGYYNSSKLWGHRELRVCWTDLDQSTAADRALVQQRIADTWARHSSLTFVGWDECEIFRDEDINIRVEDDGSAPHTEGLGTDLSTWGYMSLNFTYQNWGNGTACTTSEAGRKTCIGTNAIHEFGHALAMAHEHNRSDRDATCIEDQQGTDGDIKIGPFDHDSIMNYCYSSSYRNRLSQGDIDTIQAMYGSP